MLIPTLAHAGSWFDFEAGVGLQQSRDMGDGTWYQAGVPHQEKLRSPAYLAGFTGELYAREKWSLHYHADYVYFGEVSASCTCVTDAQYNTRTRRASVPGYIPFNGHGHTQGAALTLEPGYAYNGVRLAAEGGPWLYWATWHVTHDDPAQPGAFNLDHKTHMQLGWVAGARVEYKDFSVSYRYYTASPSWTRYPGLVTGTHMLTLVKRF
jgi:hypothetical protein